ncbi:rab11 family-interacting protein 3-like isoform X2 [Uloborus diversus]|uniref:rab11 family-interacting protein 3-like isoform X2 n=1 Tax=Uloborus diversus TaxID=327109 RepID=UPI00240A096F|nr:rab11 family-interacting protein 3-like isoform X2 [Uloborus diversus]
MATADEEFIKQLRVVFDLCDELKCGIISVDQLKDIVRKHFGGSEEEIVHLIEYLDPNKHGVVTFPDFCRGVASALQNKGTSLEEAALRCQQPTFGTSTPIVQVDGDRRKSREDSSPPPLGDTDSAIATGSDVSRESLPDKHDSDDGEESYTCLGHLSRPDQNSSGSFRSTSSHGSNTGSRRRRNTRMLNRSGSKRLSTSALASQLHRNGSRRNSQSSDEMYPVDVPMSIEDDVMDLNAKVHELQQQVATLTDHQVNTDHRYNRVKQENAALQNKIHSLEEQLRELEIRSEDRVETETQKFKEIMARCEREAKLEVEQYANKLLSLQKDYMELSEESLKLKTLLEKLKLEKQELQNQLFEVTSELTNLREDHHRLQEGIRREREAITIERDNNNKLLEELTFELEKHAEVSTESRMRSPSLLELPAQYRELQQELRKVKDENKLILETNEELNAQLLASSLQEGRSLVNQGTEPSIAEEFETSTKDELVEALREQMDVNAKLKSYIDGILLNILENHPQLLEVKNNI